MSREKGPVVYDKGKYHLETVKNYGLPESHAYHHTVFFLRWLIEHDLMSDEFHSETQAFAPGGVTNEAVLQTYEWWDCCLVDDMLADEGNAFAQHYFDFDKGRYIHDYIELLQGNLPSEFHIALTEDSYQSLKQIIDRRFAEWQGAARGSVSGSPRPAPVKGGSTIPKRWWQFWRR